MQKVGKASRFWWRALDAPTSEPAAPSPYATPEPPRRAAPRFTPPAPAPVPVQTFALAIPKADRRRTKKARTSRVKTAAYATLSLSVIAAASAALAVVLPARTWNEMQAEVSSFADRTLMATGFGIEQVSLTGQRYTLDSDVFDALDLANVKTFAALDTKAVLRRIERISWVDTAQMTRIFPGKLKIEIKERLPAAIWTRGDVTYLIDPTGRVLGPLPPKSGWVLPRVAGEGANVDMPLLFTAIERHSEIQQQFNYAERVAERRWRIVLNNGSRIELAPDREIEGLDLVASNRNLRRVFTGPPMIADVRVAGRATMRPLAASASLSGAPPQISASVTP